LSRLGIGVGAAAGSYDLICENAANGGAARLARADGGRIQSAPLDQLITGKVDFIKIDVEGMEFEVLDGATRVIRESRPKIMIEVFRPQISRFETWLNANDYRVAQRFDNVYAVNFCVEPADA
jgi:hypothetical protein